MAQIVAILVYPCVRHRMSAASPFVVKSLHWNYCILSQLSQVATEVRVTASCGDSLKSVRVKACQNCQRVVHQPGPLVEGMTYRRKIVLFPLRTDSVIKLAQVIKFRLRVKEGQVEIRE